MCRLSSNALASLLRAPLRKCDTAQCDVRHSLRPPVAAAFLQNSTKGICMSSQHNESLVHVMAASRRQAYSSSWYQIVKLIAISLRVHESYSVYIDYACPLLCEVSCREKYRQQNILSLILAFEQFGPDPTRGSCKSSLPHKLPHLINLHSWKWRRDSIALVALYRKDRIIKDL